MKEEDIRRRDVLNKYLELMQEDIGIIFANKDNFIQIPCPGCGSLHYELQFEKWGFCYVLCPNCRTLYANPRPPFSLLQEFYVDSRSTNFWVNDFFMPMVEARKEKIFRPRAQSICDEFPNLHKAVIGDIGAGFGLFLDELAKLWPAANLVAIEPSLEMSQICKAKGLTVLPCALEDVENWDGEFDLLTAFELFEHLYETRDFLKKIYELLRPGGQFILTTLNGEGFDIQMLWEKSRSISPPQHLNFLNPKSIAILLEQSGFIVETVDTPGKLDWDIFEGMMQGGEVSPERFWKIVAEKDTITKSELQKWIAQSGLSSHMRVIARKPIEQ